MTGYAKGDVVVIRKPGFKASQTVEITHADAIEDGTTFYVGRLTYKGTHTPGDRYYGSYRGNSVFWDRDIIRKAD